ncbi:MAG: outer membrane beta-barrel protein [Oligoflexia bacterium]|nr:outer membrane beta-barrel protein [Oligoflexia bacterium]
MRALVHSFIIAILLQAPQAFAQGDFVQDQPSSQGEGGDTNFDPFSDYAEFEEGSEEEADVNFFHNGRFFTLGILAGHQSFTDVLGELYKPTFTYGVFVSYFFDLRFALQAGYITADHPLSILDGRTQREYKGKVGLSRMQFDFKYYLNTQNVTRGLAALNPYLLVGVANYSRTYTFEGVSGYVRDACWGVQGGAGIEIPVLHNKMFFGAQFTYHYISFPDKGAPIVINGNQSNITPTGDALNILGIIGANF